MKNLSLFLVLVLFLANSSRGQVVYEHLSRSTVYDFLDELASEQIIEINAAVKPYSRTFIAEKLAGAMQKTELLSKRQRLELHFYLNDYNLELKHDTRYTPYGNIFPEKDHISTSLNPVSLNYNDSLFSFSVRPLWGIDYYNNVNGGEYHSWGGLEAFATVSDVLGVYTSLRDNHESVRMTAPEYFVREPGAPVKGSSSGGYDYSEARGGIMFSWKWGAAGVIKDHLSWGNSYNQYGSNIFSGRTPSFAHIKLVLKPVRWFEFNYIHGWLVSEVVDSSRSYWDGDTYREVFHDKYIAANMFTFIPVKHLNLSFGNSIVYSDIGVQAAYLVPFLFYKSVDHTLNSTANNTGQNSQMFLDISSRNLKHLHLFLTLFVDEFSIKRISEKEEHNFISYKGGFRLSNWPVKDLMFAAEYTYTLPATYQHYISTTTFESNNFNLGHYMRDNSDDLYLSLRYKPLRGLSIDLHYNLARHGNDYRYGTTPDIDRVPVMEEITWQKKEYGMSGRYEIVNNAYVLFAITHSDIEGFDVDGKNAKYYLDRFTPSFFHGKNTTFRAGFNIGF